MYLHSQSIYIVNCLKYDSWPFTIYLIVTKWFFFSAICIFYQIWYIIMANNCYGTEFSAKPVVVGCAGAV